MKNLRIDNQGFTLIEQLVSLSLVVLMTVIFSAFTADVLRSSARLGAYAEVQENSRLVLDRISQAVKTARSVTVTASSLTVIPAQGASYDISYDGAAKAVLLDGTPLSGNGIEVTGLSFQVSGNNMVEASLSTRQKGQPASGASPYSWQASALMAPRPVNY